MLGQSDMTHAATSHNSHIPIILLRHHYDGTASPAKKKVQGQLSLGIRMFWKSDYKDKSEFSIWQLHSIETKSQLISQTQKQNTMNWYMVIISASLNPNLTISDMIAMHILN